MAGGLRLELEAGNVVHFVLHGARIYSGMAVGASGLGWLELGA